MLTFAGIYQTELITLHVRKFQVSNSLHKIINPETLLPAHDENIFTSIK